MITKEQLLKLDWKFCEFVSEWINNDQQPLRIYRIGEDTFRLKVDEYNQKDYEEKGMKPFYSEKKKKGMPFWEVPIEVFEDRKELAKWALKSYEASVRSNNN